MTLNGIHHITAIAGDPQKNVDFYTDFLGLRLVKKTVNFDDPHTYHLYFGDEAGTPGSIITFFPWGERGMKGNKGTGQITATSYAVKDGSLEYWKKRLEKIGLIVSDPFNRFEDSVLYFEDFDGFEIELIASKNETRKGWDNGDIPQEFSIRGFYSGTISLNSIAPTANFIKEILRFEETGKEGNRVRYRTEKGESAIFLDLLQREEGKGRMGIGAVHHIAWRVEDNESQLKIREHLLKNQVFVTEVMDRNYFNSIYFREPGGVLFEIATDPPGFLIDEELNALGTKLQLPAWQEVNRKEIEEVLPKLRIPNE